MGASAAPDSSGPAVPAQGSEQVEAAVGQGPGTAEAGPVPDPEAAASEPVAAPGGARAAGPSLPMGQEQQRETQHRDGELRPGSGSSGIVIRRLGSHVPLLVH